MLARVNYVVNNSSLDVTTVAGENTTVIGSDILDDPYYFAYDLNTHKGVEFYWWWNRPENGSTYYHWEFYSDSWYDSNWNFVYPYDEFNFILLKDINLNELTSLYCRDDNNLQTTESFIINWYNTVLDLNGHTITGSYYGGGVILNRANLTLKGEGNIVCSNNNNGYMCVSTFGDLNIEDGVKLEGGYSGVVLGLSEYLPGNYTINFNGEYIGKETSTFGVTFNGSNKDASKAPTVNFGDDAKITMLKGAAVYGAGYANWNFNGGYFEGPESLEFKSGVITINAGIFIATETTVSHNASSGGLSGTGYALAAIYNENYAKPIVVTLNGGKFVGPVAKLGDQNAADADKIVFHNNIGIDVVEG